MRFNNLTLEEKERLAYISGDVVMSDLLYELLKLRETLEQPRNSYD